MKDVYQQCTTAGWGCIDCKNVLLGAMDREFVPIRRRAAELRANPARVDDALAAGAGACRLIAGETMRYVRERMGLD